MHFLEVIWEKNWKWERKLKKKKEMMRKEEMKDKYSDGKMRNQKMSKEKIIGWI